MCMDNEFNKDVQLWFVDVFPNNASGAVLFAICMQYYFYQEWTALSVFTRTSELYEYASAREKIVSIPKHGIECLNLLWNRICILELNGILKIEEIIATNYLFLGTIFSYWMASSGTTISQVEWTTYGGSTGTPWLCQ